MAERFLSYGRQLVDDEDVRHGQQRAQVARIEGCGHGREVPDHAPARRPRPPRRAQAGGERHLNLEDQRR